ncbi:ferredoxin [Streptomyces subrutilus]|uniref:Ferredoxin n=1 Tax=Streptomyces subrutilus TaxID=36818 RepID=A0A5P2UJG6_9ACTN|nr:ferredoxin [Streptomyces subrutilus]QEU78515.1 ferredoxin [Streptomyces subrutilus]WSJ32325.1 ferredoxin [Streptomyces subrutilus]GGZ78390.1 ferredoxin [Streptomyces subrutilus]
MRLVVDLNRCQGYAQCAFLAPDVFAMHGDESLLYDPEAAEEHREDVARAVAACPVQAILLQADADEPVPTGGGLR